MALSIFKGTINPHKAEAWIDEMEKIFRVTECTIEEKVKLLNICLRIEPHHWWKCAEHTLANNHELVI